MSKPDLQSTNERHILDLGSAGFQCVKVLGTYTYRKITESKEMHRHEGMMEIYYLDKGSQYYSINGKGYRMKGGDVLLTFPGEEHGTRDFPQEKGRFFWLIILIPEPTEKLRLLNLNLKESRILINRLLDLQSHRHFKGSPRLKNDLNKIFQLYAEKDSIYNRIKITHLLLGFILKVVDLGEDSVEKRVSTTIDQICRYIHDNIHDDLKLETIAAHGNLSLSHFKYRFKLETGIPPAEYILRQKIEAAKEMLLKNHRVTEVAYGLAFCSSSYFATVFKSYTGITPTQFVRSSKG